jgi:hypothetical protein
MNDEENFVYHLVYGFAALCVTLVMLVLVVSFLVQRNFQVLAFPFVVFSFSLMECIDHFRTARGIFRASELE